MKMTMTAIAAIGLFMAFGASPAAAQAQWASMDVQGGGKQFQLNNEDGSAIVLLCLVNGQAVAFQFAEPIESAERATVRGTPGGQRNVPVAQVAEQLLQVTGAPGRRLHAGFAAIGHQTHCACGRAERRLRGLRERIDRQGVHRAAGVPDRGPAAAILRSGP